MIKANKCRKILALLLVLAMMLIVFPVAAFASAVTSATFNFNNTAVTYATVSSGGTGSLQIIDTKGPTQLKARYESQVELSPNTTATTATIAFYHGLTNVANTSVTIPSAAGVVNSTTQIGTTNYIFSFVREPAYTSATDGSNVSVTLPDDGMALGDLTSSGNNTYTYSNATTSTAGFPQNVSMRIIPAGTNYDAVTSVSTTVNSGSTSGAALTHQAGTYYIATFPSDGSTLNFTVTYSYNNTTYNRTFVVTLNYNGVAPTGNGINAFLPAPGQFTNEGIGTGGWGDCYTSGGTNLKGMVNTISTTGVSLGSFGGYIVFDMGVDSNNHDLVQNTATNPYGVDFIVYGNAFSTNAEPGCIQVFGTSDGTHYNWYDIAGSLHYNSSTIWNASITFTNPTPGDDTNTSTSSTLANVSYTGSLSGTITTNTYHNHSWYPLNRNYFTSGMDKLSTLGFGIHTRNGSTGEGTLLLRGTLLGSATNTAASNYTFGYADVHKNGSNYSTASNPYAANGDSEGGDGIDISWAVDSNGVPVNLTSIRYVRVYTGTVANNPNSLFGEISTEVCGIYKATGTGSGAATTDLVVKKGSTIITHSNMSVTDLTATSGTYQLKIYSDEDHVFVNGTAVSCTSSVNYTETVSIGTGETKYVQVITQSGTESPYITLFRITR